jgi:hypothetical protein
MLFFQTFAEELIGVTKSSLCYGNTCKNVNKLKLKVIVHSGEALFHKIGRFDVLSGVDVVIAHRLLKNSVKYDHYILITEQAQKDVVLPGIQPVLNNIDKYDEFGKVKNKVYLPPEHKECAGAAAV